MKTRNAGMLGLVVAVGFGVTAVQAAGAVDTKATPEIQKELKQFDKNGDGYLSLEEFKAIKGMDDLTFKAADVNGDGRLNAEEYAQHMTAVQEEYKGTSKPAGESPAEPSASPPASPAPKSSY